MRIGHLRHLLTVERVTETRSATGGFTRTWSRFAQVWAEREEKAGREELAGGAQQHRTDVIFTIRHLAGLDVKMRLRDRDGRLYDIKGMLADNRTRTHTLTCVEGLNRG